MGKPRTHDTGFSAYDRCTHTWYSSLPSFQTDMGNSECCGYDPAALAHRTNRCADTQRSQA